MLGLSAKSHSCRTHFYNPYFWGWGIPSPLAVRPCSSQCPYLMVYSQHKIQRSFQIADQSESFSRSTIRTVFPRRAHRDLSPGHDLLPYLWSPPPFALVSCAADTATLCFSLNARHTVSLVFSLCPFSLAGKFSPDTTGWVLISIVPPLGAIYVCRCPGGIEGPQSFLPVQ